MEKPYILILPGASSTTPTHLSDATTGHHSVMSPRQPSASTIYTSRGTSTFSETLKISVESSTASAPAVVRAASCINNYMSAIRIFEGVKEKVENRQQYELYLQELKPLRDRLDLTLKEELYPSSL
ncbi:hypothetical protein D9756_006279 [Leucocoprinus leucothites]|uniref:Cytochrome c oxidase subunit 6, mitochondrial n=1 Tax=Leucocoprinus leucothites TaxID=201217 RepID=A0A8H5D2R4_9AGAR|nr:hypothetical protein D9756_006279 [Leucoagaricus leucothites]